MHYHTMVHAAPLDYTSGKESNRSPKAAISHHTKAPVATLDYNYGKESDNFKLRPPYATLSRPWCKFLPRFVSWCPSLGYLAQLFCAFAVVE